LLRAARAGQKVKQLKGRFTNAYLFVRERVGVAEWVVAARKQTVRKRLTLEGGGSPVARRAGEIVQDEKVQLVRVHLFCEGTDQR
jgi:hypothetical protein